MHQANDSHTISSCHVAALAAEAGRLVSIIGETIVPPHGEAEHLFAIEETATHFRARSVIGAIFHLGLIVQTVDALFALTPEGSREAEEALRHKEAADRMLSSVAAVFGRTPATGDELLGYYLGVEPEEAASH